MAGSTISSAFLEPRVRRRQKLSRQQSRLARRCVVRASHCRKTTIAAAKPKLRSTEKLQQTSAARITEIPANFDMHKTAAPASSKRRRKAIDEGQGIDWATGRASRLRRRCWMKAFNGPPQSGQDSCRGTFSQRHSHFIDQTNGGALHPAEQHSPRPSALRSHRLAALRRSGARLRIRLHARRSKNAHALGSPVWRFRERRSGRD